MNIYPYILYARMDLDEVEKAAVVINTQAYARMHRLYKIQ